MIEITITYLYSGRFTRVGSLRVATPNLFRIASLLTLLLGLHATADETTPSKTQMLIVVGSPGEAEYGKQFTTWATEWSKIGEQAGAVITEIGQGSSDDKSDFEQLSEAIRSLKNHESPELAPVWLVLIGHGTFQANVAKFNLRGPDLSAEQLVKWLDDVQHSLVIINVASSSGPFVNAISGAGRVIVTATKSGEEQNFARFGAHLPAALADPNADLDHDGEVSLLEAVLKASSDTKEFYVSQGRIQTEHALLDDNGDKLGTPAEMLGSVLRGTPVLAAVKPKSTSPAPDVDGDVAASTVLIPSSTAPILLPEEQIRRASIEDEIRIVRRSKASLDEDEYFGKLEERMLELAKIYEAAETRGKKPTSSP